MASLRPAFVQLRGRYLAPTPQWQQLRQTIKNVQTYHKVIHTRPLFTTAPRRDSSIFQDETTRDTDATEAVTRPAAWTGRGILAGHRLGEMMDPEEESSSTSLRSFGITDARTSPDESDELAEGEIGDGPTSEIQIHARALPVSPSYFSRQSQFNDSYLELQKLMRQYAHLPTVPSDQVEKVAFRTLKDFRLSVGEHVKASIYARCMTLVKRLHKIHPQLQPESVQKALSKFKRDINPHNHKVKEIPIDRFGRTLGVGKRKTSTARAWVVEGTGEVLVNGKSLADAFGRVHDRESAVWALKSTARTDKYNVWALVDGGGTTGQAEALAMAVGKALLAHEPALKPALRRAGVVTRDPRGVERKKPGHLKARKKPTWVKR